MSMKRKKWMFSVYHPLSKFMAFAKVLNNHPPPHKKDTSKPFQSRNRCFVFTTFVKVLSGHNTHMEFTIFVKDCSKFHNVCEG